MLQPAGTPMGITSAAEEGMRCDHSKRAVRAPHHTGKDYVAATGSDVPDGSISARVDPTIALALIQWDAACTNAARVQNEMAAKAREVAAYGFDEGARSPLDQDKAVRKEECTPWQVDSSPPLKRLNCRELFSDFAVIPNLP